MFGWYTPVFRVMYEVMPGVKLFRRPADATFVFGALIAIMAGYLVHRWLTERIAPLRRWQRVSGACRLPLALVAIAIGAGATRSASLHERRDCRSSSGSVCVGARSRRCRWRAGVCDAAARSRLLLLAAFTTADLAWNNAPHESTGLPPAVYDALRPDTTNETVALLKQRLATQRAEPSRPRRTDRHRLSLAEHLHDPRLRASCSGTIRCG